MQYYLAVWSVLLGLVIGSFLNVVIYRMPRGESLVSPGSHCPVCGSGIRWFDNVPVLSWILLRGRCRSCRSPISLRYPAVEGLTGIFYLAAFLLMGPTPAVFVAWALIAVLVALAFIHHDLGVVPSRLVLPAALFGLAASVALDTPHWWHYLIGSAGAGALSLLLSLLGPVGTGLGEAKIALLLGAVFGPSAIVAVLGAAVCRTLAGITLVFCQKGRLRARTVFATHVRDGDARQHVKVVRRDDSKADAEVMTWL